MPPKGIEARHSALYTAIQPLYYQSDFINYV